MNKKGKIRLVGISGIIFVLIIAFSFLLNIRKDFLQYLYTEYPEQSFKVGFTKIDILYEKYYASVYCLNDGTRFSISRGFNTKDIDAYYVQSKSIAQYNSKIKSIFGQSDIQKVILNVTGGSKTLYDNSGTFDYISVQLISDTDQVADAKKILNILKDKNINSERVSFTYEKDRNVYELFLSTNDYTLTEKEIESRIIKVK